MRPAVDQVRGVLRPPEARGKYRHARIAPSEPLRAVVQHFWSVHWDLRDAAPLTPETLPHPNVQLVFGSSGAEVCGVHTARFSTKLEGEGSVFGVKFRPGAFRHLLGKSVSTLRERTVPIDAVFGADGVTLDRAVRGADSDTGKVALVETFLQAREGPADPRVDRVGLMVDEIAADRELVKVEQLVSRWNLGKRPLQLLFNEYVGVGPKWVIGRYRLHEALERLHEGLVTDYTQLAMDLGYFDQAHFIRDFRQLVGCAPAVYARRIRIGRDRQSTHTASPGRTPPAPASVRQSPTDG
jgi:AraC-like DNA-binding protein